jgi:hypothetical protein
MRTALKSMLAVLVVAAGLLAVATATATAATQPELLNSKGVELVKKKFTLKGPSTQYNFLVVKLHEGEGLECRGLSGHGEVKGTRAGEATFTYTGCTGETKCQTVGKREGEITFTTSVTPVWLNKTREEAALLLSIKPETNGGFQIECTDWSQMTVSGAFLVRMAGNKLKTEYAFSALQKHGVQEPDEYENEAGEKVTATLESESEGQWHWSKEQSATETGWATIFEEEAELKV